VASVLLQTVRERTCAVNEPPPLSKKRRLVERVGERRGPTSTSACGGPFFKGRKEKEKSPLAKKKNLLLRRASLKGRRKQKKT